MACPNLEQLEHFAHDGPAGQEGLRAHVDGCPSCKGIIVELKRHLDLAGQIARASRTGLDRTTTPAARWPGAESPLTIPGYQLMGEISRGGQGVVYEAVQLSTTRRVAVKVLHAGHFADPRDKARFEREVQVLGQLQHPNIVSIHDSGSIGGHPFYTMDFIAGQPLDDYIAARRRSGAAPASRRPEGDLVDLFATICDAVHAAHLRGIIHRDLKPSNIRVDEEGRPHILDFGLAKLTGVERGADMTITGQFLGSLPWSSPEQAGGNPDRIDVRSDVYSLGVVLYELLTGRFPYDIEGAMHEVLDRILKADPIRPSTLRRGLDPELETIVLKCLEKEPERRYQGAGELARDLRHYLAGEAIDARRASGLYLLRKTLRRHRVAAAVSAGFILVLAGATAVSAWFGLSEARHRRRAESQAQELRLSADALSVLLYTRGNFRAAAPAFRDVLEESIEIYGEEHPFVAVSKHNLASLLQASGSSTEAEELFREALALRRRLNGDHAPEVGQTLAGLAMVLAERGEHAEAVELFRQALDIPGADARGGNGRHYQILLAESLIQLERFAEAEEILLAATDPGEPRQPRVLAQRLYNTLLNLYEAWDKAEPGKGYAEKAQPWRRLSRDLPPRQRPFDGGRPEDGRPPIRPPRPP